LRQPCDSQVHSLLCLAPPATAAGLNTAPPPFQVDWEAILAPTYQQFWASVSSWMMPELLPMTAARDLARLPLVSEVLRTPRQRIQALNRMEQMSL
jgi:hypothetical protein